MKPASGPLVALLEGSGARHFWTARCVDIALPFMTTQGQPYYRLRYTDADVSVKFPEAPGVIFRHDGACLSIGTTRQTLGLEVSQSEVALSPIDGTDAGQTPALPVPMVQAARNGAFDRAKVTIWRVFAPHPGPDWSSLVAEDPNASAATMVRTFTATGGIEWFTGFVAGVQLEASAVTLRINSALDLLNVNFPRYTYSPGCVWELYGPGCGLDKQAFTRTATMQNGSTRFVVRTTLNDGKPDGHYNEGVLMVLGNPSGASSPNVFVKRGIKEHRGGVFVLSQPLPYEPREGSVLTGFDTVAVQPGCDRTMNTCDLKFHNLDKFRGFPLLPGPDATQGAEVRDVTNLPLDLQED